MSWHELGTRAAQSANQRLDLAKYRLGLLPISNRWNDHPSSAGNFYFSTEERAERARLIQEHLPVEVREMLQDAEEICRHRFRLLGYNRLDYGSEIDWHLDAAHHKRAPLKPWHKVKFLDRTEVGDHKVTWELNRHQHLVTLAKAWVITGQQRYATEAFRQWYDWKRANPFPLGINWASSLEVGFRSMSWLWMSALLAGCPAKPVEFDSDLLTAMQLNGTYIDKYLSTYFSPNTHLIGEAAALFLIGTLCPQIRQARQWQELGWRILNEEAVRQVRPDGVYFEQSLYYHVYALDFFLHARILAERNGIDVPKNLDAILARMLDALKAVSQIGPPNSFGDDDGGRLFNSARNRSEHLTDPLAIGAILFKRPELKTASCLTEEAVWLFGAQATEFYKKPSAPAQTKTVSLESGGIYILASGEEQLVVDAGPLGTGRGGHGHADALSVTASFAGRNWLIDPGTSCYLPDDGERDQFRGTAAHNTLRIDTFDQAIADGAFSWRSLPKTTVERWCMGEKFTLFAASHNGYARLPDPVLHRRFIFHLHGSFWFIRDVAVGREEHFLESSWHFAADVKVQQERDVVIAYADKTRLALVTSQDSRWSEDLIWGGVSPAYGDKQRAPLFRLTARQTLPLECGMVVVPLPASKTPGTLTNSQQTDSLTSYRYQELEATHFVIFSDTGSPWTLGPWSSDAECLYCRIREERVEHFVAVNASFAGLEGNSFFADRDKHPKLEWFFEASEGHIFSGDHEFSETVLQGCCFTL